MSQNSVPEKAKYKAIRDTTTLHRKKGVFKISTVTDILFFNASFIFFKNAL